MILNFRRTLLALLLTLPILATAQDSSGNRMPYFFHEDFLLRLERTTFSSMGGEVVQTCIIVMSDGKFRMEKGREEMTRNGSHENKVYAGTFTPDEIAALKKLLDDPKFSDIRYKPDNSGGKLMHRSDLSWIGDVKRNGEMRSLQQFALLDEDVVKKYDKDMKPIANWLKSVEKKKLPEIKKAEPSQCRQVPEESGT